MTLLKDAVEAKKFDIRMIERNLARGVITAQDAQATSDVLPDDGENAEWISIETLAGEEQGSNS